MEDEDRRRRGWAPNPVLAVRECGGVEVQEEVEGEVEEMVKGEVDGEVEERTEDIHSELIGSIKKKGKGQVKVNETKESETAVVHQGVTNEKVVQELQVKAGKQVRNVTDPGIKLGL